MSNIMVFVLAATLLLPSSADAYVLCSGKVLGFEVLENGLIKADWGYGARQICSISSDVASPATIVPKDSCQAILSNIMTAFFAGKNLASNHAISTTCAQATGTATGSWMAEQPYSFIMQ